MYSSSKGDADICGGSARLARESGFSKVLIDSGEVGISVSVNIMLEHWTKIP
jgi:hypothetical protein